MNQQLAVLRAMQRMLVLWEEKTSELASALGLCIKYNALSPDTVKGLTAFVSETLPLYRGLAAGLAELNELASPAKPAPPRRSPHADPARVDAKGLVEKLLGN